MPLYRIVKHFPNTNNWNVGDVVDITNAKALMEQGYVKLYKEESVSSIPSISWSKNMLIEYAKKIGVKTSGTKKKILEAIKKAQ